MTIGYEDLEVGGLTEVGKHTFTPDEIIEFAQRFDPQPFHLDEAAGKASPFGRIGGEWLAHLLGVHGHAGAQRAARFDQHGLARHRGDPLDQAGARRCDHHDAAADPRQAACRRAVPIAAS